MTTKKSKPCGDDPNNRKKKKNEREKAKELMRIQQQGEGKPIFSQSSASETTVRVGSADYSSSWWKTFPDFLYDYILEKFGSRFFNQLSYTHPLLEWKKEYDKYLKDRPGKRGTVKMSTTTGICYCYLGLSYNLYLLEHNVELQDRFIKRLSDCKQFHGAYYELIVANSLIRAGFSLELEDETDLSTKHCEFSAVSNQTGVKFWVEAKCRGVAGILGKTQDDGMSDSKTDSTCSMTKQINSALSKPASGPRLIFVDVNTNWTPLPDCPNWMDKAESRLKDKENALKEGEQAYIFVTNTPFHRDFTSDRYGMEVCRWALGTPELWKGEQIKLSEEYHLKQKHIDVHKISESLMSYPSIPTTFGGGLPSEEIFQKDDRILVDATYDFVGNGILGFVQDCVVFDSSQELVVVARSQENKNCIFRRKLSDSEYSEYKAHPETYFGVIKESPEPVKDPLVFFEKMRFAYQNITHSQLIKNMSEASDIENLIQLSREELLDEFCERTTWDAFNSKC